ncbi:MAG: hypothetical protein JWO62_3111 [Acidimicrobiaceae bacterium]|nr:hypothetical protein [Acidimicrobiaceae bacterium]
MTISAVIPTKDRRSSLESVLPTYFSQPEVGEVLVVIDGSADGTRESLAELSKTEKKLRILDNGRNRGLPYSKNRGIRESNHDLIFMGEDDVELTPNFFTMLLSHREFLGVDLICGRNIWRFAGESARDAIDRTAKFEGPYVDLKTLQIITGLALAGDEVHKMLAAPMLGDSSIFRSVMFDEQFEVNFFREETDFQISAQEAGYTLGCCPHAICFNHVFDNDHSGVHSAEGFNSVKWVAINNWRFVRKHRQFLSEHFDIGNQYMYVSRVAGTNYFHNMVLPLLISTKRIIREWIQGSSMRSGAGERPR